MNNSRQYYRNIIEQILAVEIGAYTSDDETAVGTWKWCLCSLPVCAIQLHALLYSILNFILPAFCFLVVRLVLGIRLFSLCKKPLHNFARISRGSSSYMAPRPSALFIYLQTSIGDCRYSSEVISIPSDQTRHWKGVLWEKTSRCSNQ